MLKKAFLWLIKAYQKTLSPNKGIFRHILANNICAHTPHCSQYGYECIEKYGSRKGVQYATTRVLSCTASSTMTYDPSSYRVVFFGSAPISVPFLQGLYDDPRYELVGVVTMPDQAQGRGMKMQANINKLQVESRKSLGHHERNEMERGDLKDNGLLRPSQGQGHNIDVATPKSLRLDSKKYGKEAQAFKKRIKDIKPDLCIVVAYGNIIPQRLLDLPHFGCINVHGSLLPKYRGASPLQDIFLHQEEETGLTIMQMDAGIDTGPMIEKLVTKIPLSWTVKDLIKWIKDHGPRFLNETLWSYLKSEIKAIPQDSNKASHCSKITKEDGLVDIYKDSLKTVYSKWRAYYLWPKTYFIWERENGKEMQVTIESITMDQTIFNNYKDDNFASCISNFELLVKPEGKKGMSREEFLRGYR